MFNWDGASEADVREEFIAPLLARLGYARGTNCDIVREQTLRYDGISLGRTKPTDAKLQGRLDYLMKVVGGARWIIEAKPPNEEITQVSVAQALSYARHPEVSATFAAVTNGREFVLYETRQYPYDSPLVKIPVVSVDQVYADTAGILSPGAIRRNFALPKLSTARPIARDLRGEERLSGGFVRCLWAMWKANFPIDESFQTQLDDMCQKIVGFQSDVTTGRVYRTDDGRVVAQFEWSAPHVDALKFAREKGLMENKYVCLGDDISREENLPTVFDFFTEICVEEGEEVFDISSWKSVASGTQQIMTVTGQATGVLQENVFCGLFDSCFSVRYPAVPGYLIEFIVEGSFEVYLADT